MKKILFLVVPIFLFFTTALSIGQILNEDFHYLNIPTYVGGNGNIGSTSNNWITHSVTTGQTTTINIVEGSLVYPGVISTGNKAYIPGSNSTLTRDINRAFSSSATTLYFSVLLNIVDNTQISTGGEYFMHFGSASGSDAGTHGGRLGIKSVNSGANFRFIIQNSGPGSPTYTEFASNLSFGTTYLVVVKYQRTTSPTTATLWVNPDLQNIETASTSVSNNSGTATSFTQFASVCIRNTSASPKAYIDEIRVTSSWSDIPLPVTLESFTSSVSVNNVTLTWKTSMEINNHGFEVYRNGIKIDPFVLGNNVASTYVFTDKDLQKGFYNYQIKQIDLNGNYEYFNLPNAVEIKAPKNFTLKQNYPNPGNPSTVIAYELPEDSHVLLRVYDVTGKEVALLKDEPQTAGYYQLKFTGSNLSSGVYFYKLNAGKFLSIKKMLIVK